MELIFKGAGFPEFAYHEIEAFRKLADLVIALYADLLVQITGRHPD
jgi:hypothetical protein